MERERRRDRQMKWEARRKTERESMIKRKGPN
jgi:hypothetical protein